jgi:hypothetical protein
MRRGTVLMASLVLVVLGSRLIGGTMGAFSATTSNSANSFEAAPSFCTDPGSQTVDANADAWVDQLLPLVNHGTDSSLFVRSGLLENRRTLVSFPLPPVPAHCSVTLATLRLYGKSAEGTRILHAYQAAAAWTETGVTWNNQPPTTGSPAATPSGTGWREWIVTTQVQDMYSSSNYGFIVKDSVEDDVLPSTQTFSSREDASDYPQLVITFG